MVRPAGQAEEQGQKDQTKNFSLIYIKNGVFFSIVMISQNRNTNIAKQKKNQQVRFHESNQYYLVGGFNLPL